MKIIMDDLWNVHVFFDSMPRAAGRTAEVISKEENIKVKEASNENAVVVSKEESVVTDSETPASDMEIDVPEGDLADTEEGMGDSGVILDYEGGGMVDDGSLGINLGDMDFTGGETETEVKDPLLSSWGFVIGVTSGLLALGIVFGILLAKKRIKKGIDLYED